ncbi:hypothetical protein BDF20DRAFT_906690 [Mycotypha africana]|uniref:uncharacterized protein n=1 Tax=Mycotypha africana TaxID=64632 RepID=UPI0023019626|nr:uncharacterized protein BDF20DRAFT_906690 [Mycotypha africana]KAI8975264.1 hypothetical protein BDF20DRAFT_906690 [Mycotypha africana]
MSFASSTSCPDYVSYSKEFHEPGSGGLFNLPFQRPLESCRKFTSAVIESVISNITSKIDNLDLGRLFTNSFPNTLDTTISQTACIVDNSHSCVPLAFIITGDINAMWLRDSANQILPYLPYVHQDIKLKKLFLGAIYMQAHFITMDPYANAFNGPSDMNALSTSIFNNSAGDDFNRMEKRASGLKEGVWENKWEIDSLASFMSLSYRYWNQTKDNSFVSDTVWVDAVEILLDTLKKEQQPTFEPSSGKVMETDYLFLKTSDRPTETQYNGGRGQPVRYTGMVKSLFRPSDDATVFPFFIPGNAMLSVELDHLSTLLLSSFSASASENRQGERLQRLAAESAKMSTEIREAIYKYGMIDHPIYGKIFAYEVDGYGSFLIMDDANIPSLLSLSYLGFVDQRDPVYQNTRKLVLSKDNPYYFAGPRASGIGGPHVGLEYAWPMSQIVRMITSDDDQEIMESLNIILNSTDNTGLIHESIHVFEKAGGDDNVGYTRSWFAWANGLFGQAILKIMSEKPHLLTKSQ